MIWLAAAVAVLLATVAPTPAWVGLVIGALGATAVRTFVVDIPRPFGEYSYDPCAQPRVQCVAGIEFYTPIDGETFSTAYARPLDLDDGLLGTAVAYGPPSSPSGPMWVIAIGVLAWGIRRRSWRVIVAAALFGAAVWALKDMAPLVLFLAAAAAAGPRKDAHFLAGIGVLALTLAHDDESWQLIVTVIALVVASAFIIWALVRKNGFNRAVAVATLASAPLTPFLSAGVLLAAAVYHHRARLADQANG